MALFSLENKVKETALSQRAIAEIQEIFHMSLVDRKEAIDVGSSKKDWSSGEKVKYQ